MLLSVAVYIPFDNFFFEVKRFSRLQLFICVVLVLDERKPKNKPLIYCWQNRIWKTNVVIDVVKNTTFIFSQKQQTSTQISHLKPQKNKANKPKKAYFNT